MVRRWMNPSSEMLTLPLSSTSLPFNHHLTSALSRDTSISSTTGVPANLSSWSGMFCGRVSVTGGSNEEVSRLKERGGMRLTVKTECSLCSYLSR